MLVPQLLLQTLEELRQDDFKKLKWFLSMDILDGCKPIPVSRLEKASLWDTVSRMIESYGEHLAVSITVEILKKMSNNNAAERLQKIYTEGAAAQEKVSHSLVTSSSALGLPTGQRISTDGAAGAIAPKAPNAPNACYGGVIVSRNVGSHARGAVGKNVGGNVKGNVGKNVGGNVWGDVGNNVGGNVWGDVGNNVGGNVWGNVGNNVGGNVWGNVGNNVGGNVWGDVGLNVGGTVQANVGSVRASPSTAPTVNYHPYKIIRRRTWKCRLVKTKRRHLKALSVVSGQMK
ncbi:circumsporozoite protein-like [Epinephelus moara]|uniref:circumsporozoite protein-like n=1 Tax=Epinephelus moara TaxID=300413 RepID=UPI00214E6395|nr:circumsporozoite protein-like [Epinephelus moara]